MVLRYYMTAIVPHILPACCAEGAMPSQQAAIGALDSYHSITTV
jgi:hypothetical protein